MTVQPLSSGHETRWIHNPRVLNWIFWSLLIGLLVATIYPMWMGPIPPITDFGGHLIMADLWIRHESEPLLSFLIERQDHILQPNVLPARFVSFLHPAVDTITGMRLFVTLCLTCTAATALWMLHVFERSRWLIFLALPFLWNGMTALGLINYIAVIPTLFAGAALARGVGQTGSKKGILALAAIGCLAFLCHVVGVLIFIAMVAFVLLCTAPDRKRLVSLVSLLPAAALWIAWLTGQWSSVSGGGATRVSFLTPWAAAKTFVFETLDLVNARWDLACLAAIALVVVGLLVLGRKASSPAVASASRWDKVRAYGRQHTLSLMLFALVIGYFSTPQYLRTVAISIRFIPPIIFLFVMLPKDVSSRLSKGLLGLGVLIALVFAVKVNLTMNIYQTTYVEPLDELLRNVPNNARTQCAGVYHRGPIFHRPPLSHNCNGLINARLRSIAGGGFSHTPYNATRFRDSRDIIQLLDGQWQSHRYLSRLDHIIVMGSHGKPSRQLARKAYQTKGKPLNWTLYTKQLSLRKDLVYEGLTGGPGGQSMQWDCPEGQVIGSLAVSTSGSSSPIHTLVPTCKKVFRSRSGRLRVGASGRTGPRLGNPRFSKPRFLSCPHGRVLVGVAGRYSAYVNQLGFICGRWDEVRPRPVLPESETTQFFPKPLQLIGHSEGDPFILLCPTGSGVVGLRGNSGVLIDAIGIACADISQSATPARSKPLRKKAATPAKKGQKDSKPKGPGPRD